MGWIAKGQVSADLEKAMKNAGQSAEVTQAAVEANATARIDGLRTDEQTSATNQRPQKYLAGSWGPTSAIALAERHGHSWYE